jgi:hypothetical protein
MFAYAGNADSVVQFDRGKFRKSADAPCGRLASMGDSFLRFKDEVIVHASLFKEGSEIEGKTGVWFEVALPASECKCGKFEECSVFFFEVSSWPVKEFLFELERSLGACCFVREKSSSSYSNDMVCPEGDKCVLHACDVFLGEGMWTRLRLAVGTRHPNISWSRELTVRSELESRGVTQDCVKHLPPYLCFDEGVVYDAVKDRLSDGCMKASEDQLREYDARMRSVYRRFPVNSALDRKLFQLGRVPPDKSLPLSSEELEKVLGYPVAQQWCADYGLLMQGAFRCVDGSNEKARTYYANAVGCQDHPKFWAIVAECKKCVLNDAAEDMQSMILRQFYSTELIPRSIMKFQWKIMKTLDVRNDQTGEDMKYMYGASFEECPFSVTGWELAERTFQDLNKWRGCRAMSKVLDGDWKPCSTFESYMYGSAYTTLKKWKTALSGKDYATNCAIGCGHYNHWRYYFPKNGSGRKAKRTWYIDNVKFKGRFEVEVEDANEWLVGKLFDLVCSDAQCALDYSVLAGSVKKCAIIKILPKFGVDAVINMCREFQERNFAVKKIYRCGKLHNGEVLVEFAKVAGKYNPEWKKETTYDGNDILVCSSVKWILAAMRNSIMLGEDRRVHNLKVLIREGAVPRGNIKVDKEVVSHIPQKIVRGKGSMAVWASSVSCGYDYATATRLGFLEQSDGEVLT